MDSLASLALATEPPKESLLDRPPQRRDDYIISRKMVKHLLGMAIYQSIIIFALIFVGEHIIPEEEGFKPNLNGMVFPGRQFDWDGTDLYKPYIKTDGYSRHMTVVFNSFVYLQIFNMINARKINDELNPFADLLGNKMFMSIWVIIFVVQVSSFSLTLSSS